MNNEKHKPKFFIFGQGRTGSNLLHSLISCNPEIFCHSELFNNEYLKEKSFVFRSFVKHFPYQHILNQQKKHNDKVYGFKLFLYQLKNSEKLVQKLQSKHWKIIHIQRKNVLKQTLSGLIGIQTKIYYNTNNYNQPTEKYTINYKQLTNSMTKRQRFAEKENALLKDYEHIKVFYEDNLLHQINWNETAEKVFKYLEVENVEVNSEVLITDKRPDSERIINFNEMIEYLNNKGFSRYVEDYFKYL